MTDAKDTKDAAKEKPKQPAGWYRIKSEAQEYAHWYPEGDEVAPKCGADAPKPSELMTATFVEEWEPPPPYDCPKCLEAWQKDPPKSPAEKEKEEEAKKKKSDKGDVKSTTPGPAHPAHGQPPKR
jgi:hypothetical protein